MADSSVQITAGAGTPIRVLTGLGAGAADQEVASLADQYGNLAHRPFGPLRVSQEEHTLFLDTHDQALDTTNRWVAPTGANAPSVANSVLSFAVATTASAFGKLASAPSFSPLIPGFLQPSFAIKLDPVGAAATGGHRFWGIGTSPATPATTSAATKLTDAIGWELDTDGKLYAVVYAAGVRTAIDLSASGAAPGTSAQPLDGAYHRYLMQIRTDRIYWFIDGLSFYVATMSFTTPTTQTLPILLQTINPAAGVAAGGYPLAVQGSVVADTASNASQLSDGVHGWRKATVKPGSSAVAATDLPLAVALHPSSPLPAGTNSIGSVNLGGSGGLTPVAGAITAAAANTPGVAVTASTTGQVVAAVPLAGNITFHLVATAFVGTLIFEGSIDAGLNYAPLFCLREDGSGAETGVALNILAAVIRQYTAGLPGYAYFRVRCSTFTSGTIAVLLQPGPTLVEPNPSLAGSTSNIGNVAPQTSSTTSLTSPALAVTSFTVLLSNTSRKGATFYNDSVNTLYLALAAAASTTSYTVQIPPGGYYELPNNGYLYNGIVTGISAVASGNVRVTELT